MSKYNPSQDREDLLILRNEALPASIPRGGLIILCDGSVGEPEMTLSPPLYHYRRQSEVELFVQDTREDQHALDQLLVALSHSLGSKPTLEGLVDFVSIGSPQFSIEAIEGAPIIKAALCRVFYFIQL
ncbi:hypothetical protein [Bartonella sp. DGB2]|uniref:hypothetical protein n=1 Tax=Bartonella sp. DGB2 TaxID=3388426 RepID=UPI0039900A8D